MTCVLYNVPQIPVIYSKSSQLDHSAFRSQKKMHNDDYSRNHSEVQETESIPKGKIKIRGAVLELPAK